MLSRYKMSETIFGTLLFFIIYFIYKNYLISNSKYIIFETIYATLGVFLILFIKNFVVSYYQLYTLNN
jgi:hypothetical protein